MKYLISNIRYYIKNKKKNSDIVFLSRYTLKRINKNKSHVHFLTFIDDVDELFLIFFFQAEDGIRDPLVTGVQTCALPISPNGSWVGHTIHFRDSSGHIAHQLVVVNASTGEIHRYTPLLGTGSRFTGWADNEEIGRASCRERVEIWGVGVAVEKNSMK